jgi:hypothetical protein
MEASATNKRDSVAGVESIDLPEVEVEQKAAVVGNAAAHSLAQLCRGGSQPPIG